MPDDTIVIPVEGRGKKKMAGETNDIGGDCLGLLMDSMLEGHEEKMEAIGDNSELASSVVRLSGARKFNREDPLEAAAAEVMLKKKV